MYPQSIVITFLFITLLGIASPVVSATVPELQSATRLVDLVKPHEREAMAVHFMVTVSPIDLPEGVADCTVAKATPLLKDYFARLYARHLSKAQVQEAISFFESTEGRTAISLRLQHEQNIYTAAAKQETVTSEEAEYPPQIGKALNGFNQTAAGQIIIGKDEITSREPFRKQISDLRDGAFAACIQEGAAGKHGNAGPESRP